MKKILLLLTLVLAIAIGAVYLFIPAKLKISAIEVSPVNEMAAHRVLMNDANWKKWWPGEKTFEFENNTYSITSKMLKGFELTLRNGTDSLVSRIQLIGQNNDSTTLIWEAEVLSGNNPLDRLKARKHAGKMKAAFEELLNHLSGFLGKPENIYGFYVKNVFVTDSVLISTRKTFNHYPDEFETDEMIQRLKKYIAENKAKEMNQSMLHVRRLDSISFEAMAGIPTDFSLPETNEFAPKKLLKGGKLLEAEITGGHYTIQKAFQEYENYLRDQNRSSPAIPYQLLITDRIKERDTAKWVTKICYPIFN